MSLHFAIARCHLVLHRACSSVCGAPCGCLSRRPAAARRVQSCHPIFWKLCCCAVPGLFHLVCLMKPLPGRAWLPRPTAGTLSGCRNGRRAFWLCLIYATTRLTLDSGSRGLERAAQRGCAREGLRCPRVSPSAGRVPRGEPARLGSRVAHAAKAAEAAIAPVAPAPGGNCLTGGSCTDGRHLWNSAMAREVT